MDNSIDLNQYQDQQPMSFYVTPFLGFNWLVAQLTTIFLFACIAAWPFFPILIQMRPWPLSFSFLFIILLTILAWVLVWASDEIYAGLLTSFLVLLLTGLTAVQYTASQTQFIL
eukprot:gene3602-7164_t